jgi:hypothetical protein
MRPLVYVSSDFPYKIDSGAFKWLYSPRPGDMCVMHGEMVHAGSVHISRGTSLSLCADIHLNVRNDSRLGVYN